MKKIESQPAGFLRFWYFSLTIFISSFLLFQIQPLLGKYILPWFGGSSTVWTTCMMFFQCLLLGGYLYAHLLSGLTVGRQVRLHLLVLAISLVTFICVWTQWKTPVTPGPDWQPADNTWPILRIVILLTMSIGLPFFILSSTSSLIQRWFSVLNPDKSPYGFYMVSNIGSMLALLTYPFVIEPLMPLHRQALVWSVCYVCFIVICAASALFVLMKNLSKPTAQVVPEASGSDGESSKSMLCAPTGKAQFVWLFLGFLPCVLLLATSTQLTQNVAPIPFLWILPLALYLLSFIISFSPHSLHSHNRYVVMVPVSALLVWISLSETLDASIFPELVICSFMLFSGCMLCNKILFSMRPEPLYLTRYYVLIALGGALGGIFTGVVAPLTFNAYYEYQISIILCLVIVNVILHTARQGWLRGFRFPLTIVTLFLIAMLAKTTVKNASRTVCRMRNFYGSLAVRIEKAKTSGVEKHSLIHGNILHGVQFFNSATLDWQPVSYYSRDSGAGLALQRFSLKPLRIGVIGLGAGMVCVFAKQGDYLRFYEINPQVVEVARNPKYFTYLSECPATIDIAMGDARISMERELKKGINQNFDVIIIDAFSSDAIPLHLLTREAFEVYLSHLKPEGIIVFHVSNTYLDLVPVVWAQRDYFNLEGASVVTRESRRMATAASEWVLLSKDLGFFLMPSVQEAILKASFPTRMEGWTDEYSSLFKVLKKPRYGLRYIKFLIRREWRELFSGEKPLEYRESEWSLRTKQDLVPSSDYMPAVKKLDSVK